MDEKGFVEGIRDYITRLMAEKRFSTAKSYQDALNSFVRYSGTERIPYVDITKENIRGYEAYLLDKGCLRNTVSTYMRRLRCIYNKAVERDEADYIPNLFRGVFTGVESKCKKSLSIEEQHRLMTVEVDDIELRRTQLATCLMFQYGGMSFVDFVHLKAKNIKDGILEYIRQKTGTSMRIEVLDTAELMRMELVSKDPEAAGYMYPFLSGKKEGAEAYAEYKTALARFNRNLKALGKLAGIPSNVTSYTIRHSFAMALKVRNVPIEIISELLGHKSIKTTQIYLRSFSLERLTEVNSACFWDVYNFTPKVG